MKKQDLSKVKQLSTGIGNFIRYWGFRRIHGEIWSVVYLSAEPMSGIEIGKILGVSKALVSPALKELEAEGLIRQIPSENAKTKRYVAEENVTAIIQGVLKRRELPMIATIQKSHELISRELKEGGGINLDRLQNMGVMIQMAQMSLASLMDRNGLWSE